MSSLITDRCKKACIPVNLPDIAETKSPRSVLEQPQRTLNNDVLKDRTGGNIDC